MARVNPSNKARASWIGTVALVALTFAAYAPVWRAGFVNYDDPDYVIENAFVKGGLHWDTVRWAFTTFHTGNWHPLTWLSHAKVCQWWHLDPVPHHLTNLALHIANTLLL